MSPIPTLQKSAMDNYFSNYVLHRIQVKNPNKTVMLNSDGIVIQEDNLLVKPVWKNIVDIQEDLDDNVQDSVNLIGNGSYSSVYIVFPKNEKHSRHMNIVIPQFEETNKAYSLKCIPYTTKKLFAAS